MRKLIVTSLLVVALSSLTYAGEMPFPVASPQAAPTPSGITLETADGDIPNNQPAESTVTEAVLSLVQSLLALF